MRKISVFMCCALSLVACDKHDPILPGVRTAIFDTSNIDVKNTLSIKHSNIEPKNFLNNNIKFK